MTREIVCSYVLLILTCISVAPLNAHTGDYDFEDRKKYYLSEEFHRQINDYCEFNAESIATHRVQVESMDIAKRVMAFVADLPHKHERISEIDPDNSFLIHAGDNKVGMIYHFKYKSSNLPFSARGGDYFDYYLAETKPNRVKTCILDSNLSITRGSFEYEIIEESGKIYVQRRAMTISDAGLLSPMVQNILENANKRILSRAISIAKREVSATSSGAR